MGIQPRQAFTKMSEEEFVGSLRHERASEHMIEQELVGFRQLKAEYNARVEQTVQRRTGRENREVTDPVLQSYVKAGERRRQQSQVEGGVDESKEA